MRTQLRTWSNFLGSPASGSALQCVTDDLIIDNVYVPARKAHGKIEFLDSLRRDYASNQGRALVLCGDFNLCSDERDYASPSQLTEVERFPRRDEDIAFAALRATGLVDCFRLLCSQAGRFTWFDYRSWSVKRNYGMRLDYIFITSPLACVQVEQILEPRTWPRPSDHLPVMATLEFE